MTSHSISEKPDRLTPTEAQIKQIYQNYGLELPALEQAIVAHLADRGWNTYADSDSFREALIRSFEDAYLKQTEKQVIPGAVSIAAEDAAYWVSDHLQAPSPDLRDDLAPAYTTLVAKVLPAYCRRGLSPHGSIEFYPPDGDSHTAQP